MPVGPVIGALYDQLYKGYALNESAGGENGWGSSCLGDESKLLPLGAGSDPRELLNEGEGTEG